MPVKITSVEQGSPARRASIREGDMLISINSNEINDILDYRFYETDKHLSVLFENGAGERRTVEIRKGEYESIGLGFETYLMDRQHSCRNKCVFCFIDQLPRGMRPSLYFKDDDERLSFLFGNYITLTNMGEHDVNRIIQMHISPVNVSVHTTNPELRVKMMGNRFAGESLKILYRLAAAGIRLNCQLVLCKGLNDGKELERSLTDLGALAPAVQSIALVPLGVTKFREGLYPLEPFDETSARAAIAVAQAYGERFLREHGRRICYAADEFYLKANLPIPPAAFYGDFDQLENGVGLLANFKQEFEDALQDFTPPEKERCVTLVTGTAAFPFLDELLDELRIKCHNLICSLIAVENDFFGHTITVAGLVTGGDIIKRLKGKNLGEELLFPDVMLRREDEVFLDDVTVDDLRREFGIKVTAVANDGYAFLQAIIGSDE